MGGGWEGALFLQHCCAMALSGRSQVCFQAGKLKDFIAGRGVVTALVRRSPPIKCLRWLRNEKEPHVIFVALLAAAHFPFSVKVALYFCFFFFFFLKCIWCSPFWTEWKVNACIFRVQAFGYPRLQLFSNHPLMKNLFLILKLKIKYQR